MSAGQEGFRVSLQEMLECVHLAIRAIPCILISDCNEGERAIEPHAAHAIEPHADTSEYHPMLPFGEVPKGHELDVLEERSMVVSRVSHPHTVAAVENLVLRGLMTAVVTEDMGYGRRRFDASYMGMRFLARLKRS